MTSDTPGTEEQPTFESALARLEQIVTDMESGNTDLDALISGFEEGQKLIGYCTGKLNEVERRIEILVKGEQGGITTEPMPEPDIAPPPHADLFGSS